MEGFKGHEFLKGVNLDKQQELIVLSLYRDILAELQEYEGLAMTDIGAVLHATLVMYLYVEMIKNIGHADPAIIQKLKDKLDITMKKALGNEDGDNGFSPFKEK